MYLVDRHCLFFSPVATQKGLSSFPHKLPFLYFFLFIYLFPRSLRPVLSTTAGLLLPKRAQPNVTQSTEHLCSLAAKALADPSRSKEQELGSTGRQQTQSYSFLQDTFSS